MAYVPVPKDLTKVKTKVMFNLTKRQLICFTGGALIGVPLFFLLRKPTGNSVAAMCMMLVMLPFFMLAMYEKHGQPLEKIVGNILKVAVIRPKQRPYQTNNFYAVLKRQEMLDKEVYDIVHRNKKMAASDVRKNRGKNCAAGKDKERGIDPHAKVEPEPAPIEQPEDAAKVSDRQQTGDLTYYVAECMEFPNLGEYHDNLSLEEAVRIYQEIPAERMNGIKGIGFELKDGSDYEGPFPILTGQTIDLDTIQAIDYYRDNPLVQKAVKELAAAMPEMEVLGADANQQEALFLIDDATYLHIQSCDSGWDYTLYDAASMKELDGGQLDMPEISRMKAVLQICDDNDLGRDSVKYAPLSMIETLQEAAYQQMQAEASQMAASSQLPEAQEQALDELSRPGRGII